MVVSPCASFALVQLVLCGSQGSCVGLRLILVRRPGVRQRRDRCGASRQKKTGTKVSVPKVASSNPPMTARPSGAFCSPPSPRPSAIGTMPMIMASAVMMTGRKRVKPAPSAASAAFLPSVHLLLGEADHEDRVRRRHAHAHDGAGERGNADVGAGDEQHPHDSGQRARQRGDDDEGIEPALEVDDDQRIDQHDGEQEAVRPVPETSYAWFQSGRAGRSAIRAGALPLLSCPA